MLTTTRKHRMSLLLLGGILSVVTAVVARPTRVRAEAPPASRPAAGVIKLRQEQITALREAHDQATALYDRGLCNSDNIPRLSRLWVEAQLAAASSADERVAVLTAGVAMATAQEAHMSHRMTAGISSQLDVLDAKAFRLEVEIKLSEEQAR